MIQADRITRENMPEPERKLGDDSGPTGPRVDKPSAPNPLKDRLKKIDPDQAKNIASGAVSKMIQSPKSFADLVGYTPTPMPLENEVHGTTVLALEYDGGVLMFADRRATMGNLIMFDLAEKVIALDDQTVVAISGSFARSIEICRLLKHSFKYYRRMHLTPMSLEGKLQEISRALASNLGAAMSGGGIFVPILAAFDPKHNKFGVYFFDPAGARFQNGAFAAAGSGSERIRGIFDYVTQTKGTFDKMKMEDALAEGVHMLKIAAALDSATGGIDHNPPIVRVLDAEGNREIDPAVLAKAIKKVS